MVRIVDHFWTGRVTAVALAVILIVGFGLRVWNIDFDKGIGSHPDERSTACFYAPTLRMPNTLSEFWDPHGSPLNPLWDTGRQERRSFTYGHFPLYLGVSAGQLLHILAPTAKAAGIPVRAVALMADANTACGAIAVSGRLVIALLDTLSIFLIFLLGRRIYGHRTGLLAAAFYAFTAQAIQLSHFFAMDPASTAFTILAVLGAVQLTQDRTWRAALLTGLGAGLALSSKFSALPILGVPVVAGILSFWDDYQSKCQFEQQAVDARSQLRIAGLVTAAIVIALISFAITSPYAILDWKSFVQATLVEQGRMVRGVADMPFTRQYRNTIPYLYFVKQQIQWGMWWPLGLLALFGTGYALVSMIGSVYRIAYSWLASRRKRTAPKWVSKDQMGNLIIWSWVLPYFGLTGAFLAKFNRYMSPVLPFAAIFAAALIWQLWRVHEWDSPSAGDAERSPRWAHTRRLSQVAAVLLACIGLAGGVFWSLAYVNGVYAREHTWISASRWIYENVPKGSVILWELWDDPLPKVVPGEAGMDMGSTGLRNIDWSPYEEDTYEKYLTMRDKLREADYVVYSSKRIYDSVDELPERYPMTNLYYEAMRDGALGYELALDETSPPQIFGWTFQDRTADESWSLYDHPQVTVFRKVRDLTDAEYDYLFNESWVDAVPYYRGKDSPLSPLLNLLGLGNAPGSEHKGILSAVIALVSGESGGGGPPKAEPVRPQRSLTLDTPLRELPVVDNYRWNSLASENMVLGIAVWWLMLALLGWFAWPWCFLLFRSFRDRGYLLSRSFGWLAAGWLSWTLVSYGVTLNTVVSSWIVAAGLAVLGTVIATRNRKEMWAFLRDSGGLLVACEALALVSFLAFVAIRMANPDLWQPWYGGEKFMEFAFLNGILRSPTFPPVDPHFAGGFINYYYFGLYLVAYMIKLTGIHAEVSFNLVIPTLFALTIISTFSVAYSAVLADRETAAKRHRSPRHWRTGIGIALLAPVFVTLMGNLDGLAQIMRRLAAQSTIQFQSIIVGLPTLFGSVEGFFRLLRGETGIPSYDFWGPSRVIPNSINEFPYWSFLFADLHPHLIGIPFSALFLALVLALLHFYDMDWFVEWRQGVGMLVAFSFVLGTLAAVNLWELPTYYAIGVLALLVSQFRGKGRIQGRLVAGASALYLVGAYLFYLPFFHHYVNIGASGIGLVREPDDVGTWLLIWGFLGFVVVSWLVFAAQERPRRTHTIDPSPVTITERMSLFSTAETDAPLRDHYFTDRMQARGGSLGSNMPDYPTGVERWLSLLFRRFDRFPRMAHLHTLLVRKPTLRYLLGVATLPSALFISMLTTISGRAVLGLCIAAFALAWLLLWRRGPASDAGALLVALLSVTGLAILAGTQIMYLKDFLQGGDWYRMNTLFKFFTQVWVLWGIAAGVALPRVWHGVFDRKVRSNTLSSRFPDTEEDDISHTESQPSRRTLSGFSWRILWASTCCALFLASLVFLFWGTPSRLSQRMEGWRPPFGTLNGLDFMRQGSYRWPDADNLVELQYDWEAVQWILSNIRGNPVLMESSEVDYYRAGGTRIASLTGVSGVRGMHESEQRYADIVSERDKLHREFWATPDVNRTQQLIRELDISLIYVGELERHQHPDGVEKLDIMHERGDLVTIYENQGVQIYAVPGRMVANEEGQYYPTNPADEGVGSVPRRRFELAASSAPD